MFDIYYAKNNKNGLIIYVKDKGSDTTAKYIFYGIKNYKKLNWFFSREDLVKIEGHLCINGL